MSYGTDLFPSMLPCLCVCTNAIRHTLEQKSFIIILPSFPTIKIASHDADKPSKKFDEKTHQVRSSFKKIAVLKYYRRCYLT